MIYIDKILKMNTVTGLNEYIENSGLVQLAKVEATHRYYYDVACKSNNMAMQLAVSYQMSLVCNLRPDWRYRIVKYMERYDIPGPINWLPVSNKPQKRCYAPVGKSMADTEEPFTGSIPQSMINTIDFHDYENYPII